MIDYSERNLRGKSFANQDLRYSSFVNSDLRGADFSGANLNGVDFTLAKTGITPLKVFLIFIVAVAISLVSGYAAMLVGQTVEMMLFSENEQVQMAGYLSIAVALVFILYTSWKGGGNAIKTLILPAIFLALLISLTAYLSGFGTGIGMLYLVLSLILIVIMFVAGAVARVVADAASNLLFVFVAFSGGLFGDSIGGDISTMVLSLANAYISKKALGGAEGFILLRKVALAITRKFGTSFRHTKMVNARFFRAKIRNADFSDTDISEINWAGAKKINCIFEETFYNTK
jgi:uncharacterized protein YjbI with pentapeptide repeats